jgi:ABC-type microcin C transport system duplicated ATPase subunit YejF
LQYKGSPNLRLGTSFLVGNTGQGNSAIGGGLLSLIEADAKYVFHGFELDGAFGWTH